MKCAVFALALMGCVQLTKVGPFVKTIERHGAELTIVSCEIELEGNELRQGQCYSQTVPLGANVGPPGSPTPLSAR
jgi:hypothetical protein